MIHTEETQPVRLRATPLLVLTTAVVAAASIGLTSLYPARSVDPDPATATVAGTSDGSGDGVTGGDASKARVDDAILHFEIKAKLLGTLGWDAIGIDIDTLDGRVLLSGQVPDRSSRDLAEEIVQSVDGVERVDSRLLLAEAPASRTRSPARRSTITSPKPSRRSATPCSSPGSRSACSRAWGGRRSAWRSARRTAS